MGSPIATLFDNFSDNSIARAWETIIAGSATVTEASGRATCTPPAGTAGTHSAYYRSRYTYDLTGASCYININGMVSTSAAVTMTFDARKDVNNQYRWLQASGTLKAQKIVAGVTTDLYSVAWNAITYKYLRIRESGGTVYFDSSTDGSSWTNRATQTIAGAFAITDVQMQFGAALTTSIASPGALTIEDFNVPAALATTWRWAEGSRVYAHRIGSVSIAAQANAARGYLAIAASIDSSGNLVSPRYFSGPQGAGEELTEQSSQAAAEALAVPLPTNGRWYLPYGTFVEGRYVRLYMRSATGGAFSLYEFYPRRFTQVDDLEAESIRTRMLAAGAVTADKLSVLQLSAITADAGTLTAGLINGVTIKWAGGLGTLDASGIDITADDGSGSAYIPETSIEWRDSGGSVYGAIRANALSNASLPPTVNRGLRLYAEGATGSIVLQATKLYMVGEIYSNAIAGATFAFGPVSAAGLVSSAGITSSGGVVQIDAANAPVGNQIGALRISLSTDSARRVYLGWDAALNGGNGAGYLQSVRNGVNYMPTMINPIGGAVGIGMGATAPTYVLELPNIANASGQGRANAWVTYSSRALKREIAPLVGALDIVRALDAVAFRWRETRAPARGFIAEDVAARIPEAITGDLDDPASLALNDRPLLATLWAAVRELAERVEQLST